MTFKLPLLTVAFWSMSELGFGRTCAELTPRCKYDTSKLVFTGIVTEITDDVVRLKVNQLYQGTPAESVELIEDPTPTNCDMYFTEGQNYLVYVDDEHERPGLITSLRSGTQRLDTPDADLDEDLRYLESSGEVLPKSMNQLKPPNEPQDF